MVTRGELLNLVAASAIAATKVAPCDRALGKHSWKRGLNVFYKNNRIQTITGIDLEVSVL